MLKGIVTYKGEILTLEGIGDRKRGIATKAYELGYVLGVNEKGEKVFYDQYAGEVVWPGCSQPVDTKGNSLPMDPEPGPNDQEAEEPPPAPAQEPDQKPESEKDTVDSGSGIATENPAD